MNFSIFVLLTVFINCSRIRYRVTATTENLEVIHRSLRATTTDSDNIQMPEKEISRMDTSSKQNSITLQGLEKTANVKIDSSNRKSKILRSLAFLAGLSVGGLAGAASSDVKTYTKLPPLSVNVGASRISPQVAAIYNPYPYVSYPYILATPFGIYPLWDLLRSQSINGIQNNFQPLTQNPQVLNLFDNKPTDLLNNSDEYVEEAQKIESIKTPNDTEDTDKSVESQVEGDRNAEEKIQSSSAIACIMRKGVNTKQGNLVKDIVKERENTDSSLMTSNLQTINKIVVPTNATNRNTTQIPTTQNSTMNNNQTNPPFYGYYEGYPQDINQIDFTTESYEHKYHDYEHTNYNLPSYDKPVNFYSDNRYNYYSVPPVDSYPSSQFHQDPEYPPNDYKRFFYTSDNTPPFTNTDFRPVV
ncbi:uncharacterized protein LOC126923174 [Bombus affinis]|uniref:uncharacterized protein LOC126923174 n=1 Tax=Bombus affinis TaxID=309941 RepID=UPI00021A75D2|nr:uncharacterized protein LOC126923174 [Bombus affinis]XP_050592334.1 uncharacterized protein LOC126923174 [Bombus affinis]